METEPKYFLPHLRLTPAKTFISQDGVVQFIQHGAVSITTCRTCPHPDALQPTTDGTDFYIAVFKKNMIQLQYAIISVEICHKIRRQH
jgi:hypothetical protein